MSCIIDRYLAESKHYSKKRIAKIDALEYLLRFFRRLSELSKEEGRNYNNSLKGDSISPSMQKALEKCTTDDQRTHLFESWARSTYMRRCAWQEYLRGVTNEKPPVNNFQEDVRTNDLH